MWATHSQPQAKLAASHPLKQPEKEGMEDFGMEGVEDGGEEQDPATVREIREVAGENVFRKLGFAAVVDTLSCSCFSVHPAVFSPSFSPLSLLHQPAVVTFFYLLFAARGTQSGG